MTINSELSKEPEDDEPDWEVVAAGREALEDVRAGRLLTLEEAEVRFEEDLAEARSRVCAQIGVGILPPTNTHYA